MVFSTSRKGGRGVCPGTFVILGMLCALPGAVVASIGTAVVVPAADAVVLSRDDTAMATAASAALPAPGLSPDRLAQALRALVEQSRASGSPRPLGLAAGLLDRLPASQWTAEVYLMRATIHQRLHRFDLAEADLDQVLELAPGNRQAWLTRYSIALVIWTARGGPASGCRTGAPGWLPIAAGRSWPVLARSRSKPMSS